jgi:hypothetical protein
MRIFRQICQVEAQLVSLFPTSPLQALFIYWGFGVSHSLGGAPVCHGRGMGGSRMCTTTRPVVGFGWGVGCIQ